MACSLSLFSAKPLSEAMLAYCQSDAQEQTQVKLNQNFNIFIQENALGNVVCTMAAILSLPQWVNVSVDFVLNGVVSGLVLACYQVMINTDEAFFMRT